MSKVNPRRETVTNYFKVLAISCFVIIPIHGLFIWVELSDTICTFMSGYGVDIEGNVYVGKHSKIDVYEEDDLIRTIYLKDGSEIYFFEVNRDNLIVVQTTDEIYAMDLEGNFLSTIVANTEGVAYDIDTTREFFSSDGTLYSVKNRLGREKLVRYDKGKEIIVYQLPLNSYIFKTLRTVFYVILVIAVALFIYKARVATYGRFTSSPKEWCEEWKNLFKGK